VAPALAIEEKRHEGDEILCSDCRCFGFGDAGVVCEPDDPGYVQSGVEWLADDRSVEFVGERAWL